jgi:hypothetical protein
VSKITTATKWMQQGITESHNVRKTFAQTKVHAMNAGVFFIKARKELEGTGDFNDFLATFEQNISRPTVYRYIQFTEEALAWVQSQNPSEKNPEALLKLAYKAVLQSPKPFVALMRQLGEMRKFGEYDAVKYATKKLGTGPQQIEFEFDKVFSAVDLLAHIGDESCVVKYPEGKDETEALRELRDKMAASIKRLDMILEHGRVVEVEV